MAWQKGDKWSQQRTAREKERDIVIILVLISTYGGAIEAMADEREYEGIVRKHFRELESQSLIIKTKRVSLDHHACNVM